MGDVLIVVDEEGEDDVDVGVGIGVGVDEMVDVDVGVDEQVTVDVGVDELVDVDEGWDVETCGLPVDAWAEADGEEEEGAGSGGGEFDVFIGVSKDESSSSIVYLLCFSAFRWAFLRLKSPFLKSSKLAGWMIQKCPLPLALRDDLMKHGLSDKLWRIEFLHPWPRLRK